jgi:hypothetical protein
MINVTVVPAAFKHLLSSASKHVSQKFSPCLHGEPRKRIQGFLPITAASTKGLVDYSDVLSRLHLCNLSPLAKVEWLPTRQLVFFRAFISLVRQRAFEVMTFAVDRRRSPMTKKKNKATQKKNQAKKSKISRALPLAIAEPRLSAAYSAPRATAQKPAHARNTLSSFQGGNTEAWSPLRAVLRQQALVTSAFFNLLHMQQRVAHAWLSPAQRR